MNQAINRRRFLEIGSKGGAFLISATFLPWNVSVADEADDSNLPFEPNVFVRVDAAGQVTVVCHFSEMGQRIRTSIAQVIADELEADWKYVTVEQAQGDTKYGSQNTDGSRSIRHNLTRLREAGATGRHMLESAAANHWGVDKSECQAKLHQVTHLPSGKTVFYGNLVPAAIALPIPESEGIELKDRKDWHYIGKAIDSIDDQGAVTGTNVFGMDMKIDGMKHAAIARPPVLFGKAISYDASKALAIPGVERVEELPALAPPAQFKPLGGIAVIAKSTWAAIKGRDALAIEWSDGENASYDSAAYRAAMEETASKPGKVVREEGDVDAAFAAADRRIAANYYTPHLAHATMEPLVAVATPRGEGVEIWSPTQNPQAVIDSVAGFLGIEKGDVVANVTFLGGGFGRKSKADFSVEAAWLAQKINAPVKVVWTREDDIRHGYYHSACAQRFEASLDDEGKVTGLLARSVYPGISSTFVAGAEEPNSFELDLGFKDNPYLVPNVRFENGKAKAHVRIGWMRSVCNVFHAFAAQSFACELAATLKRDPKDFLLELIGPARNIDLTQTVNPYFNYENTVEKYPVDTGRLSNVVHEVADLAGWGRELPKGRGLGIAVHRSFLTYAATVMEVEVSQSGSLKIIGMWVALDAGTIVNLDAVKAQCEGGGIFGVSCALGEITASNGRIDQSNYHDYQVARITDSPYTVEVKVLESDAPPAGVGEPATPPAAPALCNAIFAATGKRIRTLPIGDQLA